MKILHLEDNALDAQLMRALFEQQWPECEINVVANRVDFLKHLEEPKDIILSDYSMPGFSGLEALRLAKEKKPKTPFIFLSGTIGEERALEALQAGAADYVIKDRPRRLIPAMERAMTDARLQREREAATEHLMRVQRLENLGMLAAGIAHDFNNVLTPVIMGASMLRNRMANERDQGVLASIERSAARGAGLVKQILGFAQGVTGGLQVVQPKHTLKELIEMMRQTFPKNIRIDDAVDERLWPINANPTQLHQVLLNLCVNARDAMPEGGVLTVQACNHEVDEMSAAMEGQKPGRYVAFEVIDSGTGIPPEVAKRMWEPFFTTKKVGLGTGLGLATVRGIVEGHHGRILFNTHVGRGTTFRILLPAEVDEVDVLAEEIAADVPHGTGELVVVVDDDAHVREVTSAMLAAHGYTVITAVDGTQALGLIAPRALEVRLVVTDLEMPNLDGAALARVLGSLNPSIRILLVSACNEATDPRCAPPPSGAFLAKPFNGEALLRTVHSLIDNELDVARGL